MSTQMDESIRTSQILKEFNDGEDVLIPPVCERWDLKVKAQKTANNWWQKIFPKTPFPPTYFGDRTKPAEFEDNKTEYKELETKKANGTITKTKEERLKELETYFKFTKPEAPLNPVYDPTQDVGCD